MHGSRLVFSCGYQIITIIVQLPQSLWVKLCGRASEERDVFVYTKSLHDGNKLIDIWDRSTCFPLVDGSIGYGYAVGFKQYAQISQAHSICSTEICNFSTDDIIFSLGNGIIAGMEVSEIDDFAGTVGRFHRLLLLCVYAYIIKAG